MNTHNVILYIFLISLSFSFFSCNKNEYDKNSIHIYAIPDSTKVNMATDSIWTLGDILKDTKNDQILEHHIPLKKENFIDLSTTIYPNLVGNNQEFESKIRKSTYYLTWDVSFSVDTVLYFLYSSDYTFKLWVNDSLTLSEEGKSSTPYFQKAKKIGLRKGENSFIVQLSKVKTATKSCFNFSLKTQKDALRALNPILNLQYLSKLSISKGEDFYIDASILEDILPEYRYSFLFKGDTILSKNTSNFNEHIPPLTLKKEGSYSCVLHLGEYTIRQPFIVGNPDNIYQNILKDSIVVKDKIIEPYLYRLNKLIDIKERGYWWQHKVNLMLEKINDPSYREVGISLRAFESEIDGTTQHYIAISPERMEKNKQYPVIINFRPAFKYKTHLLTSIYLHKVWGLNHMASLCNTNEYIVLISSNRSYNNEDLSPIGATDILESLKDAKSKYNIDGNRIFLFGSCLGAKKALQFAEVQDSNYAGMVLYNPALTPNDTLCFDRLRYLPIYLHHDIYDMHSPIIFSEYFLST